MEKILKNPILLAGTVILILSIVLGIILLWPEAGKKTDGGLIENQYTKEIRTDIDTLEKKKWNKVDYDSEITKITTYRSASKLDENQAKQMEESLNSVYIKIVGDSIESFCKKGRDFKQLNELKAFLSIFKDKIDVEILNVHNGNIKSFENAIYTSSSANKYATNDEFDETKSNNFKASLNQSLNAKNISENEYIQDLIRTSQRYLALLDIINIKLKTSDTIYSDEQKSFNSFYRAKLGSK